MSQASDPFEFIKNFWASVPGMGGASNPAMPSFDPKDLEKRLGELKQVKQWLEMNLNMLSLQINTMEMQLGALNSFKDSGYGGAGSAKARSSGPSDLDQATEAVGEAAKAAGDAGAQAIAQGAQALQAMPWANPGEWIKSMQAAFGTAAPTGAKKGAKAAGKSAAPSAKSAAAKGAAPKRPARARKSP